MSESTELLFWADQNLSEFEAIIEEIRDKGIILNKTAFYPESGGQLSDTGQFILDKDKKNKLQVIFVEKLNGKVIHYISGKIPPDYKAGQKVTGKINWERRSNLMRAHTSQHVLSAVIEDQFSIKTIKAVIDEKMVAIHLERKITEAELVKAMILVNNLLITGKKVESMIYEKNEIPAKIKSKLRGELSKVEHNKVRIMTIEDLDYSLCGGTHCQNTKEIGILFLDDAKGEIINYTFGDTALERIASLSIGVIGVSKLLASKPKEVVNRIPKIINELKELKEDNNQLNKILLKQLMNNVKKTPQKIGSVDVFKENFQFAEKKFVLQELGKLNENQTAIFVVKGPIIVVVSSIKHLAANDIVKIFCEKTDNKGGGSPAVAQVSTKNPEKDLEIIFEIIMEKMK
ncbi:MAG: hypothetical protein KGD59_11845 [Candidatus Heimdallarchaeota archaeon]|nr:hypothetical protein [Candidatus Heimdallarchaeota archaeon]MBY8995236.1 hypothetical protein [Candidatus Heimdallarchaeota archaeon]